MIPKNDKFHKRIGERYTPSNEDEKNAFEALLYTESMALGTMSPDQTIRMQYEGKWYEFKSDHINNEIKYRNRNK